MRTLSSRRPVTLGTLAELTGGSIVAGAADVTVSSASLSSSDVTGDGLFCGVPGTRTHGAAYAAGSAAAAVLTDDAGARILAEARAAQGEGERELPVLVVHDVRRWMGPVAAEIYGHPSRELTVIGITGTSGKTTTSYLTEAALASEYRVGIIGTTGTRIAGRSVPTSLTTPEAPTMQALLRQMADEGVTHVVMEVSSHALELGRVRGIDFDVVAFTNLSQDHLDFHPTMEDYFRAKRELFVDAENYGSGEAPGGSGAGRVAVVCVDDEWGRRLAGELDGVVTVSSQTRAALVGAHQLPESRCHSAAAWTVEGVRVSPAGIQDVTVHVEPTVNAATDAHRKSDCDGGARPCSTALAPLDLRYSIGLAGAFNVTNSVIALAVASAAGVEPDVAAEGMVGVRAPGRMQIVDAGQPFLAVVDYAHKPGAVAAVLDSLRDYLPDPDGRIGIVLGAGGNRDRDKRPKMGAAAAERADAVFVTDDNPRDEDPATIRSEVLAGAKGAHSPGSQRATEVAEIGDRAAAIAAAVAWARPGDAIVIAGKGHETGQEIRGAVHEFNDVAELESALQALTPHTAPGTAAASTPSHNAPTTGDEETS